MVQAIDVTRGFAGVLAAAWARRTTGLLQVAGGGVQTTIGMLAGTPIWASGGHRGDALGTFAVRSGLITEEQSDQAILALAEMEREGIAARLGDALLELGMLTESQLHRALRAQIREKILSCFQWDEIEVELDSSPEGVKELNRTPWPVPALIAEGIVRYYDDTRIGVILDSALGHRIALFDTKETVATLLNLPPQLFDAFERGGTLEEICQVSSTLNRQLSAAMLLLGFIEVVDPDDPLARLRIPATEDLHRTSSMPHASMSLDLSFGDTADLKLDEAPEEPKQGELLRMIEQEHERMNAEQPEAYLGVRPTATRKEIEAAFSEKVRPFVEASLRASTAREQARLSETYNEIAALRDALIERSLRRKRLRRTKKKEDKLDAEAAFLRGKQLLERGDRKAAMEMFEEAVAQRPEAREYQMYRAYTSLLRAKVDWDRDKAFAETKKWAKETLAQDAKSGKAHLILGRLFRLEGNDRRAREAFETAVEVAGDKEADLELRVLTRRAAKKAEEKNKRKGLFFWKKL